MSSSNVSLVRGYLLLAVFVALPLFEWRSSSYDFFGNRAISPFVILYLLLVLPNAVFQAFHRTYKLPSKEFRIYLLSIYIFLILFIITWELFSAEKTAGASTFTLIGMFFLFITSHILFSQYRSFMWKNIPTVVMLMAVIYPFIAIVFLVFFNDTYWTGYVDVVTSQENTLPIRPFQMTMIVTFATLIGCAACVGSRKEKYVLWIILLMGYVVSLTSSKSGILLFGALLLLFSIILVREKIRFFGRKSVQLFSLKLISLIFIGIIVLSFLPQTSLGQRVETFIITLVDSSSSGGMPTFDESPRMSLWRAALNNGPASGKEPILGVTNFGSYHNVFIDIYVSSGYPALISFIIMLIVIGISLIRSLQISRTYQLRIARYALLLCFTGLIAQSFINPLLSSSVTWMMLGIIAASLTSSQLANDK